MNLNDFIKNGEAKINDLNKMLSDTKEDKEVIPAAIIGITTNVQLMFMQLAQALKTEHTELLKCMPCGCEKAGEPVPLLGLRTATYIEDKQCHRCKLLAERETNDQ